MRCGVGNKTLNGADYVVRAEHPRRPGQPLRVTDKAGQLVALGGERCDRVSAEHLASMVANDYVEYAPVQKGGK